jgi:hypothetical protein
MRLGLFFVLAPVAWSFSVGASYLVAAMFMPEPGPSTTAMIAGFVTLMGVVITAIEGGLARWIAGQKEEG